MPFLPVSRAAEASAISSFRATPGSAVPLWDTWLPATGASVAALPLQVELPDPANPSILTRVQAGEHRMTGWRSTAHHGWHAPFGDSLYSHVWLPNGDATLGLGVPWGSQTNLNLVAAPAPGDFLSPSPTIGGSSVALLPPNSAGASTWWQSASRPTLHGVVDLVTGVPLAQVTDMELPFGSATFRLNRTRSATPESMMGGMAHAHAACDRWWDWTGLGWMTSENPVLLIDSAVPDLVGRGQRMIWLWLDAHHAIPFQQVQHAGTNIVTYEAPPRFRARLKHNGEWRVANASEGRTENGWLTRPTKFEISLYDGALTYTFLPVYENVPPHVWQTSHQGLGPRTPAVSSYHKSPLRLADFVEQGATSELELAHDELWHGLNPGLGLPYLGLLWRIEDQYGHRVEMTYEPVRRVPADIDPADSRIDYAEDGAAFGALRSVKLSSRSATSVNSDHRVHWTLMYSYTRHLDQNFSTGLALQIPGEPWQVPTPPRHLLGNTLAVSEIRAYAGDIPDHLNDAKWRLIDDPNLPATPWPAVSWTKKVTYHYAPPRESAPTYPVRPVLVRTEMFDRSDPTGEGVGRQRRYWMEINSSSDEISLAGRRTPWLRGILEQGDIDALTQTLPSAATSILEIVERPFDLHPSLSEAWVLGQFASVEWCNYYYVSAPQHADLGRQVAPPFSMLQRDVRLDVERLRWDLGPDTVNRVSLRTPEGHKRYQVLRLIHEPAGAPEQYEVRGDSARFQNAAPGRSMLVAPFAFRAHTPPYPYGTGAPTIEDPAFQLNKAGELSDARFITIVDSLSDSAPLGQSSPPPPPGTLPNPPTTPVYDQDTGLMPGQTGRRLVEMNPAGYVLRDRTVVVGRDAEDGPVRLMPAAPPPGTNNQPVTGLGEEFIYRTVKDMFHPLAVPTELEGELLKAERRTIGWSAAENLGRGADDGLVEYWQYRLVDVVGGRPGEKRVELAQTGTQRGIGPQATSPPSPPATRSASFLVVEGEQIYEGVGEHFQVRVDFSSFVTPAAAEGLRPVNGLRSLPDVQTFMRNMAAAGHRVSGSITRHFPAPAGVDPPQPLRQRPVKETWSIGTPRPIHPSAWSNRALWKFPVTRQLYNEAGRSEWSLVGMVRSIDTGPVEPDDIVMLTYTQHWEQPAEGQEVPGFTSDSIGRPRHIVVDARPGDASRRHSWAADSQATGPDGPAVQINVTMTVPAVPNGFWPPAPSQALSPPQITSMYYDAWGVSDTVHPDGRLTIRRFVGIDPRAPQQNCPSQALPPADMKPFVREYVFNDVVLAPDGAATGWKVFGETHINDYSGRKPIGQPRERRRGVYTGVIPLDSQRTHCFVPADFFETAKVQLALDSNGRVQRQAALEWTDQGLRQVGSTLVNDLGEVHRTLELDNTVTRLTRNALGQTLRRYVGTADLDWGERLPASSNSFNMVLVERHEYGMGIALLKSPRNASCSDPQGICEHLDRRIAHLGAVTATGEG